MESNNGIYLSCIYVRWRDLTVFYLSYERFERVTVYILTMKQRTVNNLSYNDGIFPESPKLKPWYLNPKSAESISYQDSCRYKSNFFVIPNLVFCGDKDLQHNTTRQLSLNRFLLHSFVKYDRLLDSFSLYKYMYMCEFQNQHSDTVFKKKNQSSLSGWFFFILIRKSVTHTKEKSLYVRVAFYVLIG